MRVRNGNSIFSTNDYVVSIPLNDTQDYDLIVEKNGILQRVQVKATGCIGKGGNYQVALKSCGGTKGKTYKTWNFSFCAKYYI